MLDTAETLGGGRFFDENKEDRGWASKVTRRPLAAGGLTALDVTTTEANLASFLRGLDKRRLRVQLTGDNGASFTFAWASGYDNGGQIRVQGVLAV